MAPVFTNLSVYLAIAEEALAESTRLLEAGRRPMPEGQIGFLISSDPERKSFKQSLIARNDLIHEKVVDLEAWEPVKFRVAQDEAAFAVEFVKSIGSKLQSAP